MAYFPEELPCVLSVGEISHVSDRIKTEEELNAADLTERLIFCFNQQVCYSKECESPYLGGLDFLHRTERGV